MSKKRLYLAYGSNLNLPQMSYRCPGAKIEGTSEIKDYELLFRGGKNCGYATIEPKEGGSVPVLIWSIEPMDEKRLDQYEGWPRFYGKEMLNVELGNETVSAMVYIMNEGPKAALPREEYYDTVWEGYKSAGFDTDVLKKALGKTLDLIEEQKISELEMKDSGLETGQRM